MGYITGIILAFICPLCWALATPFAKLMVAAHVHVITALILRNIVAVLFIGGFITFVKHISLIKEFNSNRSFYIPLAFFSIMCHTGGYAMSLLYLTGAQAIILHYTYPLFISIASYLVIRERPRFIEIISSVLIIIGTYIGVIGFQKIDIASIHPLGIVWILVSVLGMTAIVLFTRVQTKKQGKVNQYFILFFTNFLGGLGLALLKTIFLDWSDLANITPPTVMINVMQAIFSTVVAYICFYAAFNYISPVLISIITTFEIIVVFIYTYLILGIEPTLSQILGSLIIIFAIAIATVKRRKCSEKNS